MLRKDRKGSKMSQRRQDENAGDAVCYAMQLLYYSCARCSTPTKFILGALISGLALEATDAPAARTTRDVET